MPIEVNKDGTPITPPLPPEEVAAELVIAAEPVEVDVVDDPFAGRFIIQNTFYGDWTYGQIVPGNELKRIVLTAENLEDRMRVGAFARYDLPRDLGLPRGDAPRTPVPKVLFTEAEAREEVARTADAAYKSAGVPSEG